MYLAEAARQPEPRPRPAAEPAAPAEVGMGGLKATTKWVAPTPPP